MFIKLTHKDYQVLINLMDDLIADDHLLPEEEEVYQKLCMIMQLMKIRHKRVQSGEWIPRKRGQRSYDSTSETNRDSNANRDDQHAADRAVVKDR